LLKEMVGIGVSDRGVHPDAPVRGLSKLPLDRPASVTTRIADDIILIEICTAFKARKMGRLPGVA
jgi:hypothetical protein